MKSIKLNEKKMIQSKDDKKKVHEPFKLKSLMLEFDEYVRIFIIPQIPKERMEYREAMRDTLDKIWHEIFFSAGTTDRARRHHLLALRVELAVFEVYFTEIREVCYRGKGHKMLDTGAARRFEVCSSKMHAVMNFVWSWIKNEGKRTDNRSNEAKAMIDTEEA